MNLPYEKNEREQRKDLFCCDMILSQTFGEVENLILQSCLDEAPFDTILSVRNAFQKLKNILPDVTTALYEIDLRNNFTFNLNGAFSTCKMDLNFDTF